MQNDLISRQALIELLNKYKFGAIQNDMQREYTKEIMLRFVEEQPTAYDVEKVVAELEEARTMKGGYKLDLIIVDEVFAIVRNGGKE